MNSSTLNERELPQYPVNVKRLPKLGMNIKLNPTPQECRIIASHLGVLELHNFSAKLNFAPWSKDGVKVRGELTALLDTQCPVSLDAVPQNINAVFDAKFVPSTSKLAKPRLNEEGEMILEFDSDDIPDIYENEELDAWAIAFEYLSLEIDHFVRAENAQNIVLADEEDLVEEKTSPFAILQSLKK